MPHADFQALSQPHYIPPRDYVRDENFKEAEAHIEDLKAAVEDLRDVSWTVWSGAGTQIRDTADALCLKADVILWRLRVARHFTYPARDVLWEDILPSIADFEEIAESIVNHRM